MDAKRLNARVSRDRLRNQSGFTLIELLVVLVLLGLVAGIGVTTLGGSNLGRELENEVNRFHAVLRMAAEEAIYSNTEIGVLVDNDGYEFLTYDEEERIWQGADNHALRTHSFPEWLSVDIQREGSEKRLFGESSDENPSENTKRPQFMLLSSGEVTGFVIGMQVERDSDSRLEIKSNEQGEIILPHVEEREDD